MVTNNTCVFSVLIITVDYTLTGTKKTPQYIIIL